MSCCIRIAWCWTFPLLAAGLLLCAGCHTDMREQPRYDTLQASEFFADGKAARPLVEGTIPYRGKFSQNEALDTGKENGEFVAELPVEVDRALLERGQQRFNIYCSPCHSYTADGDGMIVRRGYRRPPSLYIERLRNAPAGHFFDVITHGFGAMPSYEVQIEPRDRWAIVAYIRVLQLSQNAQLDDVPSDARSQLEEAQP